MSLIVRPDKTVNPWVGTTPRFRAVRKLERGIPIIWRSNDVEDIENRARRAATIILNQKLAYYRRPEWWFMDILLRIPNLKVGTVTRNMDLLMSTDDDLLTEAVRSIYQDRRRKAISYNMRGVGFDGLYTDIHTRPVIRNFYAEAVPEPIQLKWKTLSESLIAESKGFDDVSIEDLRKMVGGDRWS